VSPENKATGTPDSMTDRQMLSGEWPGVSITSTSSDQGESITLFEVVVDECRGSIVGNKDRSDGSRGKLGMAGHEIRVRMRQKDACEF
jgi:hypothetical protein